MVISAIRLTFVVPFFIPAFFPAITSAMFIAVYVNLDNPEYDHYAIFHAAIGIEMFDFVFGALVMLCAFFSGSELVVVGLLDIIPWITSAFISASLRPFIIWTTFDPIVATN